VRSVTPIESADRIECVHVLGWQCVAGKGQFHEGDKCVYMEVDSFLPICEQFEFLRSGCYKKSNLLGVGFRLKTQKVQGPDLARLGAAYGHPARGGVPNR